jgi:uncharacterized protein (TIGR02600 family)
MKDEHPRYSTEFLAGKVERVAGLATGAAAEQVGRMTDREAKRTHSAIPFPKSHIPNSQRGAALVITLAILVLITVLVVSLFLSVTSERTESAATANQGDAQRLASGVVDLVKSTITQATTGYQSNASTGAPDTSRPVAWASQPGLIRTWDTSGNPYRSYRLYSSGNITVTTQADLVTDTTDLTNWKNGTPSNAGSYNALWCDLNAPAVNPANGLTYPIVTPPYDTNSGSTATDKTNGVPTDDPATSSQEGVQGFSIKSPPGYNTSGNASAVNNPAPMPVKWLYVLQDGSYVSPTGNGTTVTVSGASQSNPIIGRVAYWTDDDTCKVNINTASEGAAWDYPRAEGLEERNMGRYQPVKNEYQRYPGHPALTSLSAVFPSFGNLAKANWNSIYDILPRMGWPGSMAGTVQPNPASSTSAITPKNQRLFTSENELLFRPTITGGQREQQSASLLTQDTLKKSGFFLTANSRAPETTLFETPRISLWPINTQSTRQDAFDRTLQFCGSVQRGNLSAMPFYFQRQNSQSNIDDYNLIPRNKELYAYLQSLTSASRPIPGFGGSYQSKFGNDRNQILTEIFDYIRSGPNLYGAGLVNSSNQFNFGFTSGPFNAYAGTVMPIQIGTTQGFGRNIGIQEAALAFYCEGIQIDRDAAGNSAPGRTRYSIRPYLLFEAFNPAPSWGSFVPQLSIRITGGVPDIAPGPFGNGTQTSVGFPINTDCQTMVRPDQVNDIEANSCSTFSPQAFLCPVDVSGNRTGTGSRNVLLRSPSAISFDYPTPTKPSTGLPFTSTEVNPTAAPYFFKYDDDNTANKWLSGYRTTLDSRLRFVVRDTGASPLVLELRNPATGTLMQTLQLSFANSGNLTLPLPFYRFENSSLTNNQTHEKDFMKRASVSGGATSWHSQPGDVIRGLEISTTSAPFGDSRLAAIRQNVPASWYEPVANYNSDTVLHAHALRAAYGSAATVSNQVLKEDSSLLVSGVRFISSVVNNSVWSSDSRKHVRPLSASQNGTLMANGNPGDWDNLFGGCPDGAFINKPDEGALGQLNGSNRWSYFTSLNIAGTDVQGVNDYNQFSLVYSPNRQMYSAFQLGSLPTRAVAGNPWETLLFNPAPAAGVDTSGQPRHRGWTEWPRDHLIADLFWMPVVDPYPISEPLSTAGKINLNAGLAPFSYIRRETGLHALLKSVQVAAIDTRNATSTVTSDTGRLAYKGYGLGSSPTTPVSQSFRYDIDREATLRAMRERPEIFRSATEIAEVPLYPLGQGISYKSNHSDFFDWWFKQKMTGDNTREMPYAQLLPRVTTKSNTYTVHLRVQALKQVPGWRTTSADWATWNEARDQVVSEYRGSSSIERYVDPNDTSIPDFAQPANYSKNLAPYYRWRTVSEKQFVP